MPVPAAWVADVLVREAHPAVLLGTDKHQLEAFAVSLLHARAGRELVAGHRQPERQGVPYPLELTDLEDARPAGGAHGELDPLAGEGGGESLRQLLLQLCDLPTKLVAHAALGVALEQGRSRVPEGWNPCAFEDSRQLFAGPADLVEQLGHGLLSADETD